MIAIIQARGGSKGLSNKNNLPLGGTPLVEWSIFAAQKNGGCSSMFVLTDNPEIAPYYRADSLSTCCLMQSTSSFHNSQYLRYGMDKADNVDVEDNKSEEAINMHDQRAPQ